MHLSIKQVTLLQQYTVFPPIEAGSHVQAGSLIEAGV